MGVFYWPCIHSLVFGLPVPSSIRFQAPAMVSIHLHPAASRATPWPTPLQVFSDAICQAGSASEAEMAQNMGDAFDWLQSTFGVTPRDERGSAHGRISVPSTPPEPRGPPSERTALVTDKPDDTVLKVAMQAALHTPRDARSSPVVDSKPMAGAIAKMFGGRQRI